MNGSVWKGVNGDYGGIENKHTVFVTILHSAIVSTYVCQSINSPHLFIVIFIFIGVQGDHILVLLDFAGRLG